MVASEYRMSDQVLSLPSWNTFISHSLSWHYTVEGHLPFLLLLLLCPIPFYICCVLFMICFSVSFFPAIPAITAAQLVILHLCQLVDFSFLSRSLPFILYNFSDFWAVHTFEVSFNSAQVFSSARSAFRLKFSARCVNLLSGTIRVWLKNPVVSPETKCKQDCWFLTWKLEVKLYAQIT